MAKQIATGSGAMMTEVDRDKRYIKVDLSGYSYTGSCYRNDASIMFFASNSYLSAFVTLSNDLELRFKEYVDKDIAHLIMPYYFIFRHYVELELKGLYIAISNDSPIFTHDLNKLIGSVTSKLEGLCFNQIDGSYNQIDEPSFITKQQEAILLCKSLEKLIGEYTSNEPTVEYYRYVFENENRYISLKNPQIELDFHYTKELFESIRKTFANLRLKLIEFIYVQFLF